MSNLCTKDAWWDLFAEGIVNVSHFDLTSVAVPEELHGVTDPTAMTQLSFFHPKIFA